MTQWISLGTLLASMLVTTCYAESKSINLSAITEHAKESQSLNLPVAKNRTVQRLVGGHLTLHTKISDKKVTTERNEINRDQNWDDGILLASAGRGKEKTKKDGDDEDKKTLADQVAEGKYGLIQKEIYPKSPKRPGIISYSKNSEVPLDTENSLGGLEPDDIWLAEDHLLVLRGGGFPEHNVETLSQSPWPPIDNYQAPPRQVKIPNNPVVPPPFPVQLKENGPLEFLSPNGPRPVPIFPIPSANRTLNAPPFSFPTQGYAPGEGPFYPPPYQGNFTPGDTPFPIPPFPFAPPPYNYSGPPIPFPFPPLINGSFPEGPFPPGAAVLPPGNVTDQYDEDDPSIYYPPPYTFYYPKDNSSAVPAGPLVPGIILPPPPNFFAPLEESTIKPSTTTTAKPTRPPPAVTRRPALHIIKTTTKTTTEPATQIYATTTPIPPTPHIVYVPRRRPIIKVKPTPVYLPVNKVVPESPDNNIEVLTTPVPPMYSLSPPEYINKPFNVLEETRPAKPAVDVYYYNTGEHRSVQQRGRLRQHNKNLSTTLKPIEPTSTVGVVSDIDSNYYETNSVNPTPRPFLVYGPPGKQPERTFVSSTPVPLRAYYTTRGSVQKSAEYNFRGISTTTTAPIFYNQQQSTKPAASYYFYEENTTPAPNNYYDKEYYDKNYNKPVAAQQYFYNDYVNTGNDAYNRASTESPPVEYLYVTPRPASRNPPAQQQIDYFQPSRPRYQQYLLSRPESFNEQIAQIQQTLNYYTTQNPRYVYHTNPNKENKQVRVTKAPVTSRPIYEYSFNAAGYENGQKSFRTSRLQQNEEPFRPMVTYSLPYNPPNEQNTQRPAYDQYLYEKPASSETAHASKYYTTPSPYEYEDVTVPTIPKQNYLQPLRQNPTNYQSAIKSNYRTKQRPQQTYATTENPLNHAYYTKQEEGLIDEITKKYFTIFGQKLSNNDIKDFGVTEPIRSIEVSTAAPQQNDWVPQFKTNDNKNVYLQNPNQRAIQRTQHRVQNEQQFNKQILRPPSLETDTLVNYRQPRPQINPDSEFVPVADPQTQPVAQQQRPSYSDNGRSVSLSRDILVNYANPRPTINLDSELIPPASRSNQISRNPVGEGRPGSIVSYKLPGEGAHVYFLTPQAAALAQQTQSNERQGYYYPPPAQRLRVNKK